MKNCLTILFFLIAAANVHAQHQHQAGGEMMARDVNVDHSVYHLDAEWTDHREKPITLNEFSGDPVIVVMFYGNCTEVCPILIRDAWRLYNAVDEKIRQSVTVLAISFDTENDTPQVLADYANYEQLDLPKWHFLTSNQSTVRSFAMMLGVQYAKKGDGHFAHSNLLTVLDEEGRITKRVEGLNQPVKEAANTIELIIKNGEQP